MNLIDIRALNIQEIGLWPPSLRYTLLFLIVVFALILGYFFALRPIILETHKLKTVTEDINKNIHQYQSEITNFSSIHEQLEETQRRVQSESKKICVSEEIPIVVEALSKLSQKNRVIIHSFKLKKEKKNQFYTEVDFDMHLFGNYHELAFYIVDLMNYKKIIYIQDLDFSIPSPQVSKKINSPAMDSMIQLKLHGRFYKNEKN